ncbi:hypothetical protein B0H14DRAFT_2632664 [Mycena olivaceomarginata]|nr:hypothetical protein B0H14DRAFT_2632664 [Mycena olivaceomarginata]
MSDCDNSRVCGAADVQSILYRPWAIRTPAPFSRSHVQFQHLWFFQLKSGHRVSVSEPNGTYFTHYNTSGASVIPPSTPIYVVMSPAPHRFSQMGWSHLPFVLPTVGVVDYVRGDTKASAVHSTSTPSAPVTLAKQRKFDHPWPSSAPGPSTSVSTSTFSHSYLSTVTASVPPVLDPISTGDLMYYYPQYFAGIPPALGLPAQSLPDAGLFSIPVAFPWLLPLQVKGIVWSDFRRYTNRASNSNFGSSQCYSYCYHLTSAPLARVQDNSPFNRSPANTYSYPMAQINSTAAPSNPPIQVSTTQSGAHTPSPTSTASSTSSTSGTVLSSGQGLNLPTSKKLITYVFCVRELEAWDFGQTANRKKFLFQDYRA